MDKEELERLVGQGLSQRKIAKLTNRSQASVRYWMKVHSVVAAGVVRINQHDGLCRICKRPSNKARCGSCHTRVRRLRTKLRAIELLGGKCQRCGWDKHPGALEFHHVGQKKFNISMSANKSWSVVEKELMACELICSNCHRIEHSKQLDDALWRELKYLESKAL